MGEMQWAVTCWRPGRHEDPRLNLSHLFLLSCWEHFAYEDSCPTKPHHSSRTNSLEKPPYPLKE